MLGMGLPEIAVILVVAMIVFGPDRLPELARQAARMVRTVRKLADDAKADLRQELGDDWRDLDPRQAVREALHEPDDATTPPPVPPARILRPGEVPPFDDEAT